MDSLKVINYSTFKLLKENNLLIKLIKRVLLNESMESIIISDEELKDLKDPFLKRKNLNNEDEFQTWLKDNNTDEKSFINNLVRGLKIEKFCDKNFKHRSHAHYLERKSSLDQVIYSLIRVKDPFLASEIHQRLIENESSFEDLVVTFSEGLERESRGVIGPVPIDQGHPVISKLLRASEPGVVCPPINLDPWWLIVRVESKTEPTLDEKMEKAMSLELLDRWLDEESDQIAKNLEEELLA